MILWKHDRQKSWRLKIPLSILVSNLKGLKESETKEKYQVLTFLFVKFKEPLQN